MSELPRELEIEGHLRAVTKYGENPQQERAGLYDTASEDPLAISQFKLVGGTDPSFNNYCDIDRLLQTVTHVAAGYDLNFGKVPHIAAGAKHGNVCGVATTMRGTKGEVVEGMLEGDPRAIFGGSVMMNFTLEAAGARELLTYGMRNQGRRLLDVVVGPDFSEATVTELERKNGKLRMLANSALASLSVESLDGAPRTRYVRGGMLMQDNYTFVPLLASEEIIKRGPEASERQQSDMLLAWAIGSTSTSNTITLVKNQKLIGNGVGQQDRVSAVELAVKRANDSGYDIEGACAYSDSFFPFPDGPEKLIEAGVQAVFTSSGSIKDKLAFETFENADVTVYAIPDSIGRGFYGH